MLEIKQSILSSVQCHVYREYMEMNSENVSCWEVAKKNNDFFYEYKVCQDCIVYKYATENDESVKEGIKDILLTRDVHVTH